MNENAIKAYQGQMFTVSLRAAGGTNYTWCLTTMPEGVALASIDVAPTNTNIVGAPVDWTFNFFALGQSYVKIGFKLLCWSDPEKETKEVFVDVNIIPHNAAEGLDGFVNYNENSATFNMPPYGFNGGSFPAVAYGYPNCWPGIQKYGYPGCPVVPDYGFPGCVKYGFPGCPSTPDYGVPTREKYGYPGCPVVPDYGFPGCVKYGFPGCQ